MKNDRDIEYKMSKRMFNSILSTRSEEEKKVNPYNFVMDCINKEFNLRGTVKRLFVENE